MLRSLIVCLVSTAAAFAAVSVSPTSFTVVYKQGAAVPAPLTALVQSTGASFTAAANSEQSGWIDVNPKEGTGSVTVTITLDPRNLPPGPYTGVVVFTETSPQSFTTSLRVDLTVAAGTTVPTPINPLTLGYIAHIADGGSWKTALTVVNLQDGPQRLTVKFLSDTGRELPLPLAGVGTYSGVYFDLPANGSGTLETTGAGTSVVTGYMSIEGAANGFGAMAVFRSTTPGKADLEATSPMRFNPAKKTVIPFDNRNNFATGLALANYDIKPNTPTLLFRDGEGKTLLTTPLPLATGEHVAFSLVDRFTVLAGAVGTLELNAEGVTALGLRFNPSGSFTSIQVIDKLP